MKFSASIEKKLEEAENLKYVVSKDFVDEDGKPIEWELRCLSGIEIKKLLKKCKQKGYYGTPLYYDKLGGMMVTKAMVFPDLQEKRLQEAWSVDTPEKLLKTMLLAGSYVKLVERYASYIEEVSESIIISK